MGDIILKMLGIEKHFAGVYALKKINFELSRGEVHALLGENGAGKSTLIKVLGGIHKPDNGTIEITGKKEVIDSVNKAKDLGIGIIHQEIVLVPYLTAAENIFLGRELRNKFGLIDKKATIIRAQQMVNELGIHIDVRKTVSELTIAQQQLIEITKAVSFDAKILVMDEPTSSLTENEVEQLFNAIERMRKQGVSIIYISHRIEEFFRIADRVTVLRDGSVIGTKCIQDTFPEELITMMVARTWEDYYVRNYNDYQETVLEVEHLTRKGMFKDISFTVKKGEVVGFAGLVGAGRSEIMMSLIGADPINEGTIKLNGKIQQFKSVRSASSHGIALVPEDRKAQGLVLANTLEFNTILTALPKVAPKGWIIKSKVREMVKRYVDMLSIKTPSYKQTVLYLSGGNQQKVVLAKALATSPKLLILDEPTRGVDVGAKKEIYGIIDSLAQSGIGIIMISSELPEIINMCDRVYVILDGALMGELQRNELTQESIMTLATGGKQK